MLTLVSSHTSGLFSLTIMSSASSLWYSSLRPIFLVGPIIITFPQIGSLSSEHFAPPTMIYFIFFLFQISNLSSSASLVNPAQVFIQWPRWSILAQKKYLGNTWKNYISLGTCYLNTSCIFCGEKWLLTCWVYCALNETTYPSLDYWTSWKVTVTLCAALENVNQSDCMLSGILIWALATFNPLADYAVILNCSSL